jgi:hypothetical protein
MLKTPKVSVITPAYKAARYIRHAIEFGAGADADRLGDDHR